MIIVYPYKIGSKSAKLLKEKIISKGVNCLRVFPNKKYKYKPQHLVVNWGSSVVPKWFNTPYEIKILNNVACLNKVINKLNFFNLLKSKGLASFIPPYTTSKEEARLFLQDSVVYCRSLLQGSHGEGIIIAKDEDEIVDAPLYVKGVNVLHEIRVHVIKGKVVLVQEKRKKRGVQANRFIRSNTRGWVFCKNKCVMNPDADNIFSSEITDRVYTVVNNLHNQLKYILDFYCIDLVVEKETQKVYVLEINTAVGLTPSTADIYADNFINLYNELEV